MQRRTFAFTRLALTGATLSIAVLCAVAVAKDRDDDHDRNGDSEIRIGYAIAPVPLNLRGRNRELVGLGSYIVNAQTSCSDCHTAPPYLPGGDPALGQPTAINLAGYLGGGTAFGPFVSRNITPDQHGRPAGLTLDEFLAVIDTGIDIDADPPNVPSVEGDLLQVMPWPVFRHMTRHDKRAIYEYLSAIPCIGNTERCGTH